VRGEEAASCPGGFAYTSALTGPDVPVPSLPGQAEVVAFLRALVRASGGPSAGLEATSAAAPEGSAAAAAFAAALGAANLTDSGVRRRQAPERFDPRPDGAAAAAANAKMMRAPPAPQTLAERFSAGSSFAGTGAGGGSYDAAFTRFAFGAGAAAMPLPAPLSYYGGGAGSGFGFGAGPAGPGAASPYGAPYGAFARTTAAAQQYPPPYATHQFASPPQQQQHRGVAAFTTSERVDAAQLAAKVGPTASRWALQKPTGAQVAQFKAWAAELERGVASPDAAALTAAHANAAQQSPPMSEGRALQLLHALDSSEISLELLEASQIGRSVALLRTQQGSPAVAAAADRIARSWRATADAIITAVGSPGPQGGATPS